MGGLMLRFYHHLLTPLKTQMRWPANPLPRHHPYQSSTGFDTAHFRSVPTLLGASSGSQDVLTHMSSGNILIISVYFVNITITCKKN